MKIHSWSGSIELGVTTANPDTVELPACAGKLKNGTWIMSGISVLKDGNSLMEYYGCEYSLSINKNKRTTPKVIFPQRI